VPADNVYAANELRAMLGMRSDLEALDVEVAPAVSLAGAQLYGQYWPGIDFSWLSGHFFDGIDLRGADLSNSAWGTSSLEGAHLQCADLREANFDRANLKDANLSGANITGATFSDANVEGLVLVNDEVWYDGNGPRPEGLEDLPGSLQGDWDRDTCLETRRYWSRSADGSSGEG
jgi:uncharacterized protein YjbI with pentapeptide repeats